MRLDCPGIPTPSAGRPRRLQRPTSPLALPGSWHRLHWHRLHWHRLRWHRAPPSSPPIPTRRAMRCLAMRGPTRSAPSTPAPQAVPARTFPPGTPRFRTHSRGSPSSSRGANAAACTSSAPRPCSPEAMVRAACASSARDRAQMRTVRDHRSSARLGSCSTR